MLDYPFSIILVLFFLSIPYEANKSEKEISRPKITEVTFKENISDDPHYCKEIGELEYPRLCFGVWQRQHKHLCPIVSRETGKVCSLLNKKLKTLKQYFEHSEKDTGICTIHGEHIRIYNASTHICCSNGKVRKKRYNDNVCCNGTVYDANFFFCCNDTPHIVVQPPLGVVHESVKICCKSICTHIVENTRYRHFYDNFIKKEKSAQRSLIYRGNGLDFRAYYDNAVPLEGSSMNINVLVFVLIAVVLLCTLVLMFAIFNGRLLSTRFTRCKIQSEECLSKQYDSSSTTENEPNINDRPNTEINQYFPVNCRSNQRLLISNQRRTSFKIENSQQQCEKGVANIFSKSDSAVQTGPQKTPNVFDSMGNRMRSFHIFDENHRHLHLQSSEVSFLISQKDVKDGPIYCYASPFRNISDVHKKLKLGKRDDVIVSPAVEFVFPNKTKLAGFAIIEMPFVGHEGHVKVWRVESDSELLNPAQRHIIPRVSEVDVNDTDLDDYCKITKEKRVCIYTRRFSWFVCTCGKDHSNFSVVSTLYWSLGRIDVRNVNIASVTLYLIPNNMFFNDYLEIIEQTERKRTKGEQKRLSLPESVRADGQFVLKILLQNENWKHRLDPEDETELFPRELCVEISDVLYCYEKKDSGLPFCAEWQLENYEQNYPIGFEGVFKVKYRHLNTRVERNTVLTINEELKSPRVAYEERAELKKDDHPVTTEAAHPSEYLCSPENSP